MNTVLHRASERGHIQHGWLDTYHSFSFADYYDPKKINFGALRVINEDKLLPSKGFGMHPHNNMEIITILLSGSLAHKDSMGNSSVIHSSEIQVMSAGTGILHSEFNASSTESVHLLQIWIFPDKKEVEPRYQQITFDEERLNTFQQLVSPNPDDEGVWIHQRAWISLGKFNNQQPINYSLHSENNGLYAFVIRGNVQVESIELVDQDALGITDISSVIITPQQQDTHILLIEVPM